MSELLVREQSRLPRAKIAELLEDGASGRSDLLETAEEILDAADSLRDWEQLADDELMAERVTS
jgi:hypothetical protein